MRYLSIKNLKQHQHYRNRRPPWIKLHAALFDDYTFQCLQDASKSHLMLLWLLASQMDNRIPYDLAFISRKLGTTSPVDVEELVLQGFIEVSQDDSKPLASRKQMTIVETETETETDKRSSPVAPKGFTADESLVLEHYRSTHPRRKTEAAKAKRYLAAGLKHFTADELCRAIDGNAGDPWHCERGKHELSYVLRDVEHISGFLEKASPRQTIVDTNGDDSIVMRHLGML